MIRYSKFIVYFTAIVLGAWLLPWLYHFATPSPVNLPFTLYSCVSHTFAYIDRSSGENVYRDETGKVYSSTEFDSILPTFYYRQLIADGRLPKTISGKPADAKSIQRGNFIFRHIPSNVNVNSVPLYALLEGMSGRVDLTMPDDVFRLGKRMEFINMKSNKVDEEKSIRFTQALLDKGFVFPARCVAGNPTSRKEYDEGYLIVDAHYQVFHVKCLRGRPFVRNTGISPELKMKYAFVTEFRNHRYYGFLTDAENRMYVLEAKTYQLRPLPVEYFDPEKQGLTVFGDDYYWTLQVSGDKQVDYYAVEAENYGLAARKTVVTPSDRAEYVGSYLFPFQLTFTSSADKFVYPRIMQFSAIAYLLNLCLAIVYLCRNKKPYNKKIFGALLLLFFGVFALFPVWFLQSQRSGTDLLGHRCFS